MQKQRATPSTETKKSKFGYGYVVVLAVSCIQLLSWGMWAVFPIFFEQMLAEFGWTRAATSGAFSIYILTMASVGIVMGRFFDRFGPRVIVSVCGLVFGLGYILTSQVGAIWQLYIFYGVMLGIGGAGWVPATSTVARWFVKRRGLMTGIAVSAWGLSMVIMPAPATWLLFTYGWRTSYIIIGIITTSLIIISAQFLKREPGKKWSLADNSNEAKVSKLDSPSTGLSFQEAVRTKQLWTVCLFYFFILLAYGAYAIHIVIYVTGLGITMTQAANMLVVSGAVSIFGGITLAGTGDKAGNKLSLTVTSILMIIASLWLQLARELWMFYLFSVIFGLAYGAIFTLMAPTIAELFGLKSHGTLLGFLGFWGNAGQAVGPIMAGHIFDTTASYRPAFLICLGTSLLSLTLALMLRPIKQKEA